MHRSIHIIDPWERGISTELTAMSTVDDPWAYPMLVDRATLVFNHGPVSMHLKPSADELMSLAQLCTDLAKTLQNKEVPA